MYVKLTNGEIGQFPYTPGDFRRDNPHTSFPKVISDRILNSHQVFSVEKMDLPSFNIFTQTAVQNTIPHKEVMRMKTEEDATDSDTGEVDESQIGQPMYGDQWLIGYTVENKTLDEAEINVRAQRNLLIAETDYLGLSDNVMSVDQAEHRQLLRDISDQEGFPFSVVWP